ncbi:MAG: hypothetical protein LBD44_01985 [Spirochaetaceae bacterium]|nr:hypothetical protein [Spirochaetaceae bacterium]
MDEVLFYAAHVEHFSNHPAAIAVRAAFRGAVDTSLIEGLKEIPGRGD